MSEQQSLPLDLHTADYFVKTRFVKTKFIEPAPVRSRRSIKRGITIAAGAVLVLIILVLAPRYARADHRYELTVTVDSGVAEVNGEGTVLHDDVLNGKMTLLE